MRAPGVYPTPSLHHPRVRYPLRQPARVGTGGWSRSPEHQLCGSTGIDLHMCVDKTSRTPRASRTTGAPRLGGQSRHTAKYSTVILVAAGGTLHPPHREVPQASPGRCRLGYRRRLPIALGTTPAPAHSRGAAHCRVDHEHQRCPSRTSTARWTTSQPTSLRPSTGTSSSRHTRRRDRHGRRVWRLRDRRRLVRHRCHLVSHLNSNRGPENQWS